MQAPRLATVPDYNHNFHVIFGKFGHTWEGTNNTMKYHTVPSIALGPLFNLEGGICCYSLNTGKILNQKYSNITLMLWPSDLLRCVAAINRKQKSIKGLLFGNRQGELDKDITLTGMTDSADREASKVTNADEAYRHNIGVDKTVENKNTASSNTEPATETDNILNSKANTNGNSKTNLNPKNEADKKIQAPTNDDVSEHSDNDAVYTRLGHQVRLVDYYTPGDMHTTFIDNDVVDIDAIIQPTSQPTVYDYASNYPCKYEAYNSAEAPVGTWERP